MISSEIAGSIAQRYRRPATWGVILVFALVWIPARMLAGVPMERMGIWEFIVPALFLAGHLALSAAPWQWTGDSRPNAPLGRGVLQALPWNMAWVFLLLWGVHDLVQPARQIREPRRPHESRWSQEDQSLSQPRPMRPEPRRLEPAPPRPDSPDPELPKPELSGPEPPRLEAPRLGPPNLGPSMEDSPPPEGQPPPDKDPSPRGDARPKPPQSGLRPELMLLFLNFPFSMILGWFLSEKERAEAAEREMTALARQAQTRALQSQVHPHALYNTLSGLTELVHEDPDAAEEALVALTELLRMLTHHANASELPLSQERDLIRHHLHIEEIRLGPRLTVTWSWPDWADAIVLPPLLLQPLVENAIKHGISPAPEGGALRISALRAGQELVLGVANTGKSMDTLHGEGTGLKNLRERLALMEHLAPSLELRSEDGWTVAELRLRLS